MGLWQAPPADCHRSTSQANLSHRRALHLSKVHTQITMKHTSRIATSLVPLLCALVQAFAAEKEEGWNPDTKFPPL